MSVQNMKKTIILLSCLVAMAAVKYEAASIKPSKSIDRRRFGMEFLPGGRFRSTNMPFLPVLATAYNIPFQSIEMARLRMKNIPDWILADPYDIEATAEPIPPTQVLSAKARNERIRLLLQSMLADRLKLKMRRALVEMPVYGMVAARHGLNLEKAKITEKECTEGAPFGGTGCHQFQGGAGRGIRALAIDMTDLALYVSNWSDRPVVDQTGITGLYAIQTAGWGSDDPSLMTLDEVLDRAGLKLVARKAPVEVWTIVHVERPSPN